MIERIMSIFVNVATVFSGKCPDPDCKITVISMDTKLDYLKDRICNSIVPTVEGNTKTLSDINGYLRGLKNSGALDNIHRQGGESED